MSYTLLSQIDESKIFEMLKLFTFMTFNQEIEIFTILIRINRHLKILVDIITASDVAYKLILLTND